MYAVAYTKKVDLTKSINFSDKMINTVTVVTRPN